MLKSSPLSPVMYNESISLPQANFETKRTILTTLACGVFFLAVVVRLVVALTVYGKETGDTRFFRVQADTVLAGQSPYSLSSQYANYPPFWLYFVPAGVRAWSNLFGWPMDFGIKILPILMDGFMCSLIFIWLYSQGLSRTIAAMWSLAFALNPLAIFNDAFQGQVDSLPIGLSLIATLMFLRPTYRWKLLGALTLGFAISFKTYPLMFLPFFLWEIIRFYGWTWKKITAIVIVVLIPWAIQLIALVFLGHPEALSRTLVYMFVQSGAGGSGTFGPLAIIKWSGIPVSKLTVDSVSLPVSWGIFGQALVYILDLYRLLLISKVIFGSFYLLICAVGQKINLTFSILLSLLLIFVFIGGYFNYYLMWLLPFAVLCRQRFAIVYSLAGFALIISKNPAINLLFWLVCLAWLITLAVDTRKHSPVLDNTPVLATTSTAV